MPHDNPAGGAPRVRFIAHQGKQILFMDLSHILQPEEALPLLEQNRALVAAQPPASLLTLTLVSGSRFNRKIIDDLRGLMAHNKPFVKAGAIVGMSPLMRALYVTLMNLTGRRMSAFDTEDQAKEWLVTQ